MIHLSLLKNITNDAREFIPTELFKDIFSSNNDDNCLARILLLIKNSIQINILMNEINQKNRQIHPYSSSPKDWPLLTGIFVGMWSDETNNRQINCMGNLFVYLFSFIGLIIRFFQIIHFIHKHKYKDFTNIIINVPSFSFIGWVFSYFPFLFIKRTLFLYHYQISLLFSIINYGFVSSNSFYLKIFSILSIFGFFYWKPFLYGAFLEEHEIKNKIWSRKWRYGDLRHQRLIETFFPDFTF